MNSTSTVALSLAEIVGILVATGMSAVFVVVVAFRFNDRLGQERSKTEEGLDKLRKELTADITAYSALKALETEVRAIPDKLRNEFRQEVAPVSRGIEEVKKLLVERDDKFRDRFMDAALIKENFAAVGVRLINVESEQVSQRHDYSEHLKQMTAISGDLGWIKRKLSDAS